MLLAIDVGNTSTKVYNMPRGGQRTFDTPAIINRESARQVIDPGMHKDVVLIGASVVPNVKKYIDEASEEVIGKKPVWIEASMPLGVTIAYKTPETLGADRLANVLGALELAKPPIIVVDLGTATKFEAISHDGIYLGGSIMPSAQMGLRSLRSDTAQLPTVAAQIPQEWIGTNTTSAILTGAMYGHEYGVHGMLSHFYGYLGAATHELEEKVFANIDEWTESMEKRGGYYEVTAIFTGGNLGTLRDLQGPKTKGLRVLREENLTAIGLSIAAKRLGLVD
jgi:type III pantothenate kinase